MNDLTCCSEANPNIAYIKRDELNIEFFLEEERPRIRLRSAERGPANSVESTRKPPVLPHLPASDHEPMIPNFQE